MILKFIPPSDEHTAVHQLPEPDMVVDPTPADHRCFKFEVTVKGTVVTFTRIDRDKNKHPGWCTSMHFRVYSRNEFHYSFESTKYLYHGIRHFHGIGGEYAPRDVTEIIVKDGIETIGNFAFSHCSSLSKITIPDTVTRIEPFAFNGCHSLCFIQLPPNLQYIEENAFEDCSSFYPNIIDTLSGGVTEIDDCAFMNCKSLRIINIPDTVQYIGYNILQGCDELMPDEVKDFTTHQEYYLQWLKSRYNHLHNLCWDPSVTANNIHQYIQTHHDGEERAASNDRPQFTPLHLLAANPSVTGDMIMAYLQLAPDVATMQDNIGGTPLHTLCSAPSFADGTGSAIEAYIDGCLEGKQSAFMKDNRNKTPFDYLCERNVDELLFLENKTFAGLMVWWYEHCLDISLFAKGVDVKENRKRKDLE